MPEMLPNNSDFLLYTSQDGEVRVDVFVHDETVWLTQKAMQELFDRSKSTVSEHISNVFKEGELAESQVVRKFRTTADDGKEIKELNRLVELYLNFAELQAERNIPMKMSEWIEVLDVFLKINRYELLENTGKISNEQAIAKASQEFKKFRVLQDKKYLSDFDKEVNKLKNGGNK